MQDQGLFRLDGKTVAVVGAASGIGEAVALAAARQASWRLLPSRRKILLSSARAMAPHERAAAAQQARRWHV